MLCGDGSLQGEGARSISKRFLDQRQCLSNLLVVPAAPILVFKQNKIASFIQSGVPPGIVQQHQG